VKDVLGKLAGFARESDSEALPYFESVRDQLLFDLRTGAFSGNRGIDSCV
jgi:hypothetical protein